MVDVVKVGAAVASATLARDRLQAALPRLQQQLKEVREREYTEQWCEDYAVVKAKRDELVAEVRERYPQLVDEMVGLMTRMADTDKEVDRVNSAAPYGDHPRLRSVELAARGVDRLMQPDISIPQELRLPNLHPSSGQLFAWPPPQPNFALQLLRAMYPGNYAYAELARSEEAGGS